MEEINDKFKKLDIKKTYIDLCAGTGAFSYVFDKYNYKQVYSNDYDEGSKIIYTNNFPNHNFIFNDLNTIDINTIPKCDILTSGFPCQPYSQAGEKKGFNDVRSNIFWKIIDIIKLLKPSIVIFENVKNLLTHDKGNTFNIIKKNIESAGYHTKHSILDTSKYTTIPHHRERLYIIGFLNENDCKKFNFDFEICKVLPIKNFLESDIDKKYYYTDKLKSYKAINEQITKTIDTNTLYQYRRYYIRENKSGLCPTLTANMGSGGHNVPLLKDNIGIRKLTPKECFNLQGFPNDYKLEKLSDAKLYKLAGNAVSIPIIELIIKKIQEL
jgi:DNA (cytosine-5)-methyltransferase 1